MRFVSLPLDTTGEDSISVKVSDGGNFGVAWQAARRSVAKAQNISEGDVREVIMNDKVPESLPRGIAAYSNESQILPVSIIAVNDRPKIIFDTLQKGSLTNQSCHAESEEPCVPSQGNVAPDENAPFPAQRSPRDGLCRSFESENTERGRRIRVNSSESMWFSESALLNNPFCHLVVVFSHSQYPKRPTTAPHFNVLSYASVIQSATKG